MEFDNIKDFRHNFYNIYHQDIAPILPVLDKKRQNYKNRATSDVLCVRIPTIIVMIYSYFVKDISMTIAGLSGFIFSFFLYPYFQKTFEQKIKSTLMPLMMQAFGSFSWSSSPVIEQDEIKNSKLFLKPELLNFDDNFNGIYRKAYIKISEIVNKFELEDKHSNKYLFTKHKGVLISLNSGKKFSGHTILRKKIGLQAPKFYEEVKLEDPQFQQMYFVESTDQVEARFILTPAFMERLKKITNSFNSDDVQCSFRDGKLLIYLPTPHDLFKIGDLGKPLTVTEPMQKFLEELISIFEMVDHLKISDKTGL